jgi:hypothetical protein
VRLGERTVTLACGREVSNYSQEWREECLARTLLQRPRDNRLAFYAAFAKRNGEAAAKALRDSVVRLYRQQQEAGA